DGLGDDEVADEVDTDDALEIGGVHLQRGDAFNDAGCVDHAIDAAELVRGVIDGGLDAAGVGDIELHAVAVAAEFRLDGGDFVGVGGAGDDASAGGGAAER